MECQTESRKRVEPDLFCSYVFNGLEVSERLLARNVKDTSVEINFHTEWNINVNNLFKDGLLEKLTGNNEDYIDIRSY